MSSMCVSVQVKVFDADWSSAAADVVSVNLGVYTANRAQGEFLPFMLLQAIEKNYRSFPSQNGTHA